MPKLSNHNKFALLKALLLFSFFLSPIVIANLLQLTLKYSTDGTTYKAIIDAINEQGFNADGKKATKKFNHCVIATKGGSRFVKQVHDKMFVIVALSTQKHDKAHYFKKVHCL